MLSKIIITHDETVTDSDAIMAVSCVIDQGRVSKSKHGDQYTWITTWRNGTVVSTRTKRHPNAADSFNVYREDR